MLTSEQPNLPSLWSFFNPNNPHHQQMNNNSNSQMSFNPAAMQHLTELSNYPQHIELEFEESIIRKPSNNNNMTPSSNAVNTIDVMRLKSSPDSIAAAAALNSHPPFSEPSYCYLQSSIPPSLEAMSAAAPLPPTCMSQVVSSSNNPHLSGGGANGVLPPHSGGSMSLIGGMNHTSMNNAIQPFDLSQASTPPFQRCSPDTTSQIPSVSDYPGEFGFTMSYGSSSQNVAMSSGKGALWTFSEQTQKLYVKMAATCPVKFQTVHRVPQGCYLRAMSVFKQPEHVKQVVTRCPNHAHGHSKDSFNEGHPAPSHLIRCEHPTAEYQEDAVNGRQSVVVPFDSPQVGTDFVVFLYNFMCYGSCVGGLNRRPIQVVFTLERDGHVLGRRAVEVRICACPSRDRKSEENALNPSTQHKRGEKRGSKSLALRDPMTMAMACSPTSAKRRKHDTTSSGDGSDPNCSNDVFYIPVKGQYYYNLVSALYKQLCVHNGDVALFEELQGSLGSTQSANNQDNESALSSLIKTDHQNENQHNSEDNNAPPSTPALAETPPASPGPQDDNLDLNFGDHGDFADTSIAAFLNRIGCSYAIECFMSRNILHTGELAHLADHEIIGMNLDEVTQSKILQAKRDLAANGSLTNSTYPSQQFSNFDDPGDQLMVVRTASNSSMTILPNGDMRQTRYTLHHSVSFLKSAGNSFELKNNSSLI